MTNHEMVGELVTERDAEVLAHLTDVRVSSLTGDDAGSFKLTFAFSANPYFSNKVRPRVWLVVGFLPTPPLNLLPTQRKHSHQHSHSQTQPNAKTKPKTIKTDAGEDLLHGRP
jgi:hypothetical protein